MARVSDKALEKSLKQLKQAGKGLAVRNRYEKRIMDINSRMPPDRAERWRPGFKPRYL